MERIVRTPAKEDAVPTTEYVASGKCRKCGRKESRTAGTETDARLLLTRFHLALHPFEGKVEVRKTVTLEEA